jgi:hypothetical protein
MVSPMINYIKIVWIVAILTGALSLEATSLPQETVECTICLESPQGGFFGFLKWVVGLNPELIKTSCDHNFHEHCLN